jgi:hypothetical protein
VADPRLHRTNPSRLAVFGTHPLPIRGQIPILPPGVYSLAVAPAQRAEQAVYRRRLIALTVERVDCEVER